MLLLSVILLISCHRTGDLEAESSGEAGSGSDSTATEENNMLFHILTSDGKTPSIVYADGADETLFSTVTRLKKTLEGITGKDIPVKNSLVPEDSGSEIIIGDCGRAKGAEFTSSLRYKDWGYSITESTVVIGGHTSSNILRALNYFIDRLVSGYYDKADDGSITLQGSQSYLREADYAMEQLTLDGVNIKEYNVIYGTDADDAAEEFCERVASLTGYSLLMLPAISPEGAHEILFGDTGRAAASDYYSGGKPTLGYVDYSVELKDGRLIFAAGTILALDEAYKAFSEQYLPMNGSKESLELTAGKLAGGSVDLTEYGITGKTPGSDIRIMSSNVYFYNFSLTRVNIMYETFVLSAPDVLCLQEMSREWHTALDPLLEASGYEPVPFNPDPGLGGITFAYNYTPIYYLPELYTVAASGYKQFETVKKRPDGDKSNSKSYTWALFERKSDGRRFTVISTHLTWYSDPTQAEAYRVQDAGEITALVAKIEADYSVPVMVLGDMNTGIGNNAYKKLTSGTLESVRKLSPASDTLLSNTYHTLGEMPLFNSSIIDHILVTKANVRADYYATLYNSSVINGSDHCPVMADLTFIK